MLTYAAFSLLRAFLGCLAPRKPGIALTLLLALRVPRAAGASRCS